MLAKPFQLSAKVVIRDAKGRCLLLKRSMDSKGNPGKWDFPGGKIDPGESFEQGLMREVAEETGLTISLQRLLAAAESEAPTKRVVYLIMEGYCEAGEVHLSPEHDAYTWANRQDLTTMGLVAQFRTLARSYSQGGD